MGRRRAGEPPACRPLSPKLLSEGPVTSVDPVMFSPESWSRSTPCWLPAELRRWAPPRPAETGRTKSGRALGESLLFRVFHGHRRISTASTTACSDFMFTSWCCCSCPNSWNICASSSTACWMIFRRLAEWFSRPPILWSAALRTLPMLSLRALCSCSCAASTSTTFFSSLPKRAPSSSRIDSSTSFASTLDCCSSCLPLSSSSSPTLLISTAFFAPALLHSATTPSVAEIFLLMTSTSLAKTLSSAALALSNDSWICFCSSPCLLSRSSALASSCPPFADSSLVSFAFVSSKS
mmetsp:Transcript_51856/g.139832  ORF Transcript_51856/g.139832 Transcript_51856/m.139832 type:complete len:294 (+) Transcript_51856:262-1143(+)